MGDLDKKKLSLNRRFSFTTEGNAISPCRGSWGKVGKGVECLFATPTLYLHPSKGEGDVATETRARHALSFRDRAVAGRGVESKARCPATSPQPRQGSSPRSVRARVARHQDTGMVNDLSLFQRGRQGIVSGSMEAATGKWSQRKKYGHDGPIFPYRSKTGMWRHPVRFLPRA